MPTNASVELGNQILQTLAAKSLSASELARSLKADRDRIYRQCRRLEKEKFLTRTNGIKHNLYCVSCRKVITADIYQTCRGEDHDIRSFASIIHLWEIINQLNSEDSKEVIN